MLIVAAVAFPCARVACNRRIARAFPRVSIAFAFLLLAGALAVLLSAWLSTWLMRLEAVAGLAALGWHTWRARPGFGRSRGLPPGSLRILPVEAWVNHRFFQNQAEQYGPIFKVSHFSAPMVCIVGLRRGLDVLHRYDDTALRSPAPPFARFLPCGFLRGMARHQHEHYRAVIRNSITPAALGALEPFAVDRVRPALRALAGESAKNPAGAFAPTHWDRLLLTLFLRLFFGIDERDPDDAEVRRLFPIVNASGRRTISLPWLPADRRIRSTLARFCEILLARCARWRARMERGEAIPDCLLAEIHCANPAFAQDPEVTGLLIYMLDASARDLAGLLQWIIKMLCDHPEVAAGLRDEIAQGIDQRDKSSLAHRIIWETLRLEQSEHIYRRVLEDIEVGDFRIPRGWLLRVCVRESHRLPEAFPNPETFAPARFLERPFSHYEFAPLGVFQHACLGDGVTSTVSRILLTEIVRGYEVEQIGTAHRDFRGWHWTPGSDFRVALRPVG